MIAQDYIKQALSFLGIKEGGFAHKCIVNTYNSIRPLPVGYNLKITDSWCAAFCSAMAWMQQIPSDRFPYECSVSRMVNRAKDLKIWVEDESVTPKPGWLAIYSWKDPAPGTDNKNTPNHVGIVEKVAVKNIYVIEGNYNNQVKKRKININGKFLRGYIALKFDETKEGTNADIAREVIAGKWGNGADRIKKLRKAGYNPDTIQALVNKMLQ